MFLVSFKISRLNKTDMPNNKNMFELSIFFLHFIYTSSSFLDLTDYFNAEN